MATSKVRGQPGVELVAQLPQRAINWVQDTVEGEAGEGEVSLQPAAATGNLMRLAAELIRTAAGGQNEVAPSVVRDADLALLCVESLR